MGDVGILKAAHHMSDRIDLADGGEKLVAETFALRGAAHQARNIDKGQPGRDDLAGFGDFRQFVEPGIGHRDLADIRLDGAERIIRRLRRRRLGQRIEQRRLADIGQPDNTAFESHRASRSFAPDCAQLFWVVIRRQKARSAVYPPYPRVSIFSGGMDRRIKSGDDKHYFSSSSLFSKNPLACSARCTLFWNVESFSVASRPALSAIAWQRASTQGRSLLAKSDSTWPCTSSLMPGWPIPIRTRRYSLPICEEIERRPLWPAMPPPTLTRTLPAGNSSSS